jgi:glutamyl/glutaminyl-tRNA synthetase
VEAVQNNLATLSDIGEYLDIFNDDKYQILDEARQLLLQEESRAVLRALYQTMRMQNADDHPYETLVKTVRVKTGFKGKKLYMPIRAAITGRTLGPELDKIFAVLGKSSILKRLQKVI